MNCYILVISILLCGICAEGNAQWISTNGPYGPSIVNYLTTIDTILFAGIDGGGMYRSTNNGTSWQNITAGLGNGYLRNIASCNNTLLAATSREIFISTNYGNSWISKSNGLPANLAIHTVAMFDTIMLAGTYESQIYRSTDLGANWLQVDPGKPNTYTTCFGSDGRYLFTGRSGAGLLRSTDYGLSWVESDSGIVNKYVNSLAFRQGNIYAGTAGWIYISSDSGKTWSSSDSGYISNLSCFSIIDSNIFAGTYYGGGIFVSADNGQSWRDINSDLPNALWIYALTHIDKNLFAATGSGIFLSTNNGDEWLQTNFGNSNTYIFSVAGHDKELYAASSTGAFFSRDYGQHWKFINKGLKTNMIFSITANDSMVVAGTSVGIFMSTDKGENWKLVNDNSTGNFTNSIIISDTNIFAGTYTGVSRSTNKGISWSTSSDSINPVAAKLAVSGNYLFAGVMGQGIYRSDDYAKTWEKIDSGLTDLFINCIFANDNYLYAGTQYGKIYISGNKGASWKSINLTNGFIHSLFAIDKSLFAGTSSSVYYSPDNGLTWRTANSGLPGGGYVNSFTLQENKLYAGTGGKGVYSLDLSVFISTMIELNNSIPADFCLYQNFPNPFNPLTTINYSIPKTGFVTLKVYDILGREIASLVNDEKQPGDYSVKFYGTGFSSGIYFYQLRSGEFISTKKFILMK